MLCPFQEAFIEGEDHGILVTLLNNGSVVGLVKSLGTGSLGAVTGKTGLAATHDTAAAAGHDFDQVITLFPALPVP